MTTITIDSALRKQAKDALIESVYLVREAYAWQAACAWRKEKDAKLCEAYAIDRHALYKGKPPYTGKEPGRYDPYTEGASDAADLLADKIRSGL